MKRFEKFLVIKLLFYSETPDRKTMKATDLRKVKEFFGK